MIDAFGEDIKEFKMDPALAKFLRKKFRLPEQWDTQLKKGLLSKRQDHPNAERFKQEIFLLSLIGPLIRLCDNNAKDILLVPENQDDLEHYPEQDWVIIKYLTERTIHEFAKIESERQTEEAKYLAANPGLVITAETTGTKRKVFDPNEVAKEDLKAKKLRKEALNVAKPQHQKKYNQYNGGYNQGRGARINQPQRGGRGGRGSRGRGGRGGGASQATNEEKA